MYEVLHPVTQKPTKWIDIGPIIRRSREILEEFHPPSTSEFQSLNALQKLTFSLAKFRNAQKMKTKIMDFMTFDDYFMHWEEWMTRAAEWLMHSEHFYVLPNHEKVRNQNDSFGVKNRLDWSIFENSTGF
ncbi:hypothetical protein B9Z55_021637 [Caenorhabditis nigoni]|uniref:NR LBD domain-containing protein n=1 Tax=Caenorhabditis nigoni TaxID=1611254 RepID=A0A2G5TTG2_9PELO|nr:hypothetical protein B9Z55_021637 [Caenorhabditis nigoni]